MTHFLNASELAEACNLLGLDDEEALLIGAAQMAAQAIAHRLGIRLTVAAVNEPGFGGLCAGFGPAELSQRIPAEIVSFDSGSDWAEGKLSPHEIYNYP